VSLNKEYIMNFKLLFFLLLTFILGIFSCTNPKNTENTSALFLVCGDSKVLMVDLSASSDSIPEIVWYWDAHYAEDLPENYRKERFNGLDECKPVNSGKQILISSSYTGAVAVIDRESKGVLFYADVPNAHSVELLPGNLLAAAASTAVNGNRIIIYDLNQDGEICYTDSLYSAHGLVWDSKRNSLYALGYDVLREYKTDGKREFTKVNEWIIPGISGHDLQMAPGNDKLFMTENRGAWLFDLNEHSFHKIENFPDQKSIKSLNQNENGQFLYTVAEVSWWAHHVRLLNPERTLKFPDMKLYKARWMNTD
jgi:hypothetical protein